MTDLARFEHKLDQISNKLDMHLERIAKVEASNTWLKWALSLLITLAGTAAAAFAKSIG